MNPLSFLSQVTVVAVEVPKKAVARAPKQWQPLTADLRIWSSGAIFPSSALIAEMGLEYVPKESEEVAYGLDIIDTAEMAAIKSPERFIAISQTDKTASRVDIFGMTRYADSGEPLSSVADQGSATFGKEYLLPLLKEVYNLEPNEEGFIDLNIHRDMPFESANGIFRFPKLVSRGAQKGEVSYVRRENQTVFALVPAPVGAVQDAGKVDTDLHADVAGAVDGSAHDAVLLDESEHAAELEDTVVSDENPFSETPVFTPAKGTAKA